MQDASRIMDVLTRFHLKGFSLAIDDFGTGHSILVQFRRLPFSEVKIDKSFASDTLTSKDSAVIIRTLIAMARNPGIDPAAEGVKNKGNYCLHSNNLLWSGHEPDDFHEDLRHR